MALQGCDHRGVAPRPTGDLRRQLPRLALATPSRATRLQSPAEHAPRPLRVSRPSVPHNNKPMLLFCGFEDVCGDLCKYTREVAGKMVNTPGYARFLNQTGHSLDNEHPSYIAREIAEFLK